MVLAFAEEYRGEGPKGLGGGTEPRVAKRNAESPAFGSRWMEEVCGRENCLHALARVKANRGSAGVDGMTVQQLRSWDRTFSDHSYGFRPGRSAHQAVEQAQRYIADGRRWVVDMDLEKFFDRVNHDRLMAKLAERIEDEWLLRLIRSFLQAGVMEGGLVQPVDEGTPQGGPLSPLLSNIVLDELDRELEKRGLRFVSYADDCNIYVASRRAGQRVMTSVTAWLSAKLRLTVNQSKSAVARPGERKFLGFSFTRTGVPKRRIAPKAVGRFKERVREITRRTRGIGIEPMVEELSRYLRGWLGYFGHCQTPSVLRSLGEWTRRRLRSVVWKQWKTGRRRFAALRQRGVGGDLAAKTAWRLSRSLAAG